MVDLLRVHTSEGRLTLDEFSDRVGRALAATTRADLDAVVDDLPTQSAPIPDNRRRRATRWVVAVMSGATRKGRWRTGSSITAVAIMGGAELDFRQAEIDAPEVVVTAFALMGGIDIVVPEGIEVELTGMPIMGGKHIRVADVPILPGSPRIVIRAFPIMGGVTVRSRPDRIKQSDRVEIDGGIPAGRTLPAGGSNPLAALDINHVMERANRHVARQMDRAERHLRRAQQQWGAGYPAERLAGMERPSLPGDRLDVPPPAPPPPAGPPPAAPPRSRCRRRARRARRPCPRSARRHPRARRRCRTARVSRSSAFAPVRANRTGSPPSVHTRCRRRPQNHRECDAQ